MLQYRIPFFKMGRAKRRYIHYTWTGPRLQGYILPKNPQRISRYLV